MPLSERTNALLPLAGKTPQIFSSIRDAKQQGAATNALEARAASERQRADFFENQSEAIRQQAAQQAAQDAEFESIVRGVNELSPLIPQSIEDVPQFIQTAQKRSDLIRSTGGDSADTDQIIQMAQQGDFAGIQKQFDDVQNIARQRMFAQQGAEIPRDQSTTEDPAGVVEFDHLSSAAAEVGEDGLPTARAKQAQVALGTLARAGTESARERIAGDDDLTDSVADSEATIRERGKFAELNAASRSKAIDKGFTSIESIDKNVRNMDRAITELQNGASTGVIESKFFPTMREATLKLEQIQGELALDVVGAVTFGALSKGELDLAKEVALPVGLQPDELISYLQDRKAAQEKLRGYYAEQIDFLDQGGSVAGFLRQKGRVAEAPAPQEAAPVGRYNPETGQIERN